MDCRFEASSLHSESELALAIQAQLGLVQDATHRGRQPRVPMITLVGNGLDIDICGLGKECILFSKMDFDVTVDRCILVTSGDTWPELSILCDALLEVLQLLLDYGSSDLLLFQADVVILLVKANQITVNQNGGTIARMIRERLSRPFVSAAIQS